MFGRREEGFEAQLRSRLQDMADEKYGRGHKCHVVISGGKEYEGVPTTVANDHFYLKIETGGKVAIRFKEVAAFRA